MSKQKMARYTFTPLFILSTEGEVAVGKPYLYNKGTHIQVNMCHIRLTKKN